MNSVNQIDAIIFDGDGTLLNSMQRQHDWFLYYWREIHGNRPWPFPTVAAFSDRYNQTLDSTPYPNGVQIFYDELQLPCDMKDQPDPAAGKPGHNVWPKYNTYKDTNPSGLYPGMKEVLTLLYRLGNLTTDPAQSRRLRMAVNTNNTWGSIAKELIQEDVIQYFDSQIGAEMLDRYQGQGQGHSIKKPSKLSLALTLKNLGTKGSRTIHIADTRSDLVASRGIFMPGDDTMDNGEDLIVVGAAWGYEGRELLEQGAKLYGNQQVHFDYIIDNPKDLVWLIKKHRGL